MVRKIPCRRWGVSRFVWSICLWPMMSIPWWKETATSRIVVVVSAQRQQQQRPRPEEKSDGYEFVQQVLQEEQQHDGDDPYGRMDEVQQPLTTSSNEEDEEATRQRKQQQEEQQKRKAAEEEARLLHQQQEELEQIRKQREAEFEREVSRMNEVQAKRARKKKRHDARVVKRILRASSRNDHYGVLGLRNWNIVLGELPFSSPRTIRLLGKWTIQLPGFLSFLTITSKDIKKAYRKWSVVVHPDRNKDGRAPEAFIALEHSASFLSDEPQRAAYDAQLQLQRHQRHQRVTAIAQQTIQSTWKITTRTTTTVRKLLGPFAFPAFILGSLIV